MRGIILTLVLLASCKQTQNKQVSSAPNKVASCAEMNRDECGTSDQCFPFLAKTTETKSEVFLGCISIEVLCVTSFTCYQNTSTGIRAIASKGCNVTQDWVSVECSNDEKSDF